MIQKIVNSIQKCKKCFNLKRCTQPAHLKPLEKGFKEVEIRGLETTTTFPDRICKGSIELKKDTDAFIPNTYNIYSNVLFISKC